MFKHILIPIDGSPLSDEALDRGIALARALGARVTVLSVVEPFHVLTTDVTQIANTREEYEEQAASHAARILEAAASKARAADVPVETATARDDHPYSAIVRAAEERDCDLISMASHGRRGMAALVVGSQTSRVLSHSKIPVLVFR